MKIAICISGHARNFEKNSKYLFDDIILPNSEHEIDIFISTWDKINSSSSFSTIRRGYVNDSDLDISKFLNIYKPKMYIVEKNNDEIFKKFDYAGHSNNPRFVVAQLYKINQVGKLLKFYMESTGTKYDLVMKTRFDILYQCTEKIDPSKSNEIVSKKFKFDNIDPNYFNVEHDCELYSNWIHDKVYISNSENYFKYIEIYENFEFLIDTTGSFTTEQLTFHWLENCKLPIKKTFDIRGIAITGFPGFD